MAISFVGSYSSSHASTSPQVVAFSNLRDAANAQPTLQADDFSVVVYVHAMATQGNRTLAQCTPSGYTAAHAAIIGNAAETNSVSMAVSYKKMPATPDTEVTIPAAAATTNGVAYAMYVFRGVDPNNPLDVTTAVASAINTGVANAPSITPTSAGAWIMACGGAAVAAGAVFTNPAGLSTTTNHFRSSTITSTTNDANVGVGLKTDWASGAFDPAAFGGSTTTNTGSWGAATLALRPATTPISANVTVTEANDTSTASAVSPVKSDVTVTEANDTSEATATVRDAPVLGSVSATEENDTASSAAVTPDKAVLSVTEENDTTVSSAVAPDRASVSVTEGPDTTTALAVVPDTATLSVVEADDTATSAAVTPIVGSISAQEADDTSTSSAVSPDTATLSIVEQDDTVVSTAGTTPPILGSVTVIEENDTSTATAIVVTPIITPPMRRLKLTGLLSSDRTVSLVQSGSRTMSITGGGIAGRTLSVTNPDSRLVSLTGGNPENRKVKVK